MFYLAILIEEDSLQLSMSLKHTVKNVPFVQAIGHVYSPLGYFCDVFVLQSGDHFFRIELVNSFAFFLLLKVLVGLSLFLNFGCFELFQQSFDLICKRTVFSFDLGEETLDSQQRQTVIFSQSILTNVYTLAI